MKGKDKGAERRKHERLPIMDGVLEPLDLRFATADGKTTSSVPAVLTNISAGGMSLVAFSEPPQAKVIEMDLHLPGMRHIPLEARITWVHAKGETYALGMAFEKISKKDVACLQQMALDFTDCETRIGLGLPEACVPDCTYNTLCSKSQKAPHFPPRA